MSGNSTAADGSGSGKQTVGGGHTTGGNSNGPALGPPTPEDFALNMGPEILWACGWCIALITLFFAGRIASRRITRVGWRPSDWILLAAIICTYATCGLYIWTVHMGAGKAFKVLATPDPTATPLVHDFSVFSSIAKITFTASTIYFAAVALTKLSILALFYEVFGLRLHHYRIPIFILAGLVLGWWLAFTIVNLLFCIPLHATWDLTYTGPKQCVDNLPSYIANGVSNVVTDALILVLPVRVVWGMQLSMGKKAGLLFIFLLGGAVCIVSAFRLAYTVINTTGDPSFGTAFLELWSAIELTAAIICANLPIMRPVLRKITPDFILNAISSSMHSSRRFYLRNISRTPNAEHRSNNAAAGGQGLNEKACKAAEATKPDAALHLARYSGPGGSGWHTVKTQVSTGEDTLYGGQVSDEEKAQIHVTQDLSTVEQQRDGRHDSEGTVVEDTPRPSANASTQELFTKEAV